MVHIMKLQAKQFTINRAKVQVHNLATRQASTPTAQKGYKCVAYKSTAYKE